MTKTIPEITDEMVKRALSAFVNNYEAGHKQMRAALTAALTKPEIEVTSAMLNAGRVAMDAWWDVEDDDQEGVPVAEVYRAMVNAVPSGAKSAQQWVAGDAPEQVIRDEVGHWGCRIKTGAPQGVNAAAPEKATGGGVLGTLHARKGEKKAHQHRRKDDAAYVSFFSLDRA
jgi:hypothetical protein